LKRIRKGRRKDRKKKKEIQKERYEEKGAGNELKNLDQREEAIV
jgi:hypothetical protein